MPACGCFLLLDATGCFSLVLVASGCCWCWRLLLAVTACSWLPLAACGYCLLLLVSSACFWLVLLAYECSWLLLHTLYHAVSGRKSTLPPVPLPQVTLVRAHCIIKMACWRHAISDKNGMLAGCATSCLLNKTLTREHNTPGCLWLLMGVPGFFSLQNWLPCLGEGAPSREKESFGKLFL